MAADCEPPRPQRHDMLQLPMHGLQICRSSHLLCFDRPLCLVHCLLLHLPDCALQFLHGLQPHHLDSCIHSSLHLVCLFRAGSLGAPQLVPLLFQHSQGGLPRETRSEHGTDEQGIKVLHAPVRPASWT